MALLYEQRMESIAEKKKAKQPSPNANSTLPMKSPASKSAPVGDPRTQQPKPPVDFNTNPFANKFKYHTENSDLFKSYVGEMTPIAQHSAEAYRNKWDTPANIERQMIDASKAAAGKQQQTFEAKQKDKGLGGKPWEEIEAALDSPAIKAMTPQEQKRLRSQARSEWEAANSEATATIPAGQEYKQPTAPTTDGPRNIYRDVGGDYFSLDPFKDDYEEGGIAGVVGGFGERLAGSAKQAAGTLATYNPMSQGYLAVNDAMDSAEGQEMLYGKEAGEKRASEIKAAQPLPSDHVVGSGVLLPEHQVQPAVEQPKPQGALVDDPMANLPPEVAAKKTKAIASRRMEDAKTGLQSAEQKKAPKEAAVGVPQVVDVNKDYEGVGIGQSGAPEAAQAGAAGYMPNTNFQDTIRDVNKGRDEGFTDYITGLFDTRNNAVMDQSTIDIQDDFWHDKAFMKATTAFLLGAMTYGADLGQVFNNANAIYENQRGKDMRVKKANEMLDTHSFQAVEQWIRDGDHQSLAKGRKATALEQEVSLEQLRAERDKALGEQRDFEVRKGTPLALEMQAKQAGLVNKINEADSGTYKLAELQTYSPQERATLDWNDKLADLANKQVITQQKANSLLEQDQKTLAQIQDGLLVSNQGTPDKAATEKISKAMLEQADAARIQGVANTQYNIMVQSALYDPETGRLNWERNPTSGMFGGLYLQTDEASMKRHLLDMAESYLSNKPMTEEEMREKGITPRVGQTYTAEMSWLRPMISSSMDKDDIVRLRNEFFPEVDDTPEMLARKSAKREIRQRSSEAFAGSKSMGHKYSGDLRRALELTLDKFVGGVTDAQLEMGDDGVPTGVTLYKTSDDVADALGIKKGQYLSSERVTRFVNNRYKDLRLALDEEDAKRYLTDPAYRKAKRPYVEKEVKRKKPLMERAIGRHRRDMESEIAAYAEG